MPDINVITPFSVDGTRGLPIGPEIRFVGASTRYMRNGQMSLSNNNNLEEEFLFGTSKYTERWFDETNHCYREKTYFGLSKYDTTLNNDNIKYKYCLDYYEYDTQPADYDATVSNSALTLDYHKRVNSAGNKVYKLYYIDENGTVNFICKKTITQTTRVESGITKTVITKSISYTE